MSFEGSMIMTCMGGIMQKMFEFSACSGRGNLQNSLKEALNKQERHSWYPFRTLQKRGI